MRFAAYAAACVCIGLDLWLRRTFGALTLDQLLWHLRYAEDAALGMSQVFVVEFLVEVLVLPLAIALVAALCHAVVRPHLAGRRRHLLRAVPAGATAGALVALALQFSVVSYAQAYFEPDRFAQEYVDPATVWLSSRQRHNLVVIYAESLEAGYGNSALFGHDLLAPLRSLGGRSYDWYRPAAGATWTMAGMVATQCGVPLKVYSEGDVRRRPGAKSFLPGATCLGDVLQAHGYRSVFLGGAPLSFSGKGQFLRDHGYGETWGREEWERSGVRPGELNAWGLYDSALFDRARAALARLHAAGQPFNLTLLTLDTHNPRGFLSGDCSRRGAAEFEGIVSCTAREIADFIRYARAQGYLKDTTVVVIGDHLAPANPVHDLLVQAPRRGMFNLFVGDQLPPANTRDLLPFDLFPTLVELAGIDVHGNRLGLGYSAVGDVETGNADERAERWSLGALRGSRRYDALWSAHSHVDLGPHD